MNSIVNLVSRAVSFLAKTGAWLSIFCLLGLSAMITLGSLSRYLFNMPILGIDEISGYLNVLIGFLALAYTLQKKGHVRVDIAINRLSHKTKNVLEIVGTILAMILVGQFLRAGGYTWILLIQREERSQTYLQTLLAIPYGFMMAGWALMFLAIIIHLVKVIMEMRGFRQPDQ